MELTFDAVGPDLSTSTFDVLSPPNLSAWITKFELEKTISVVKFVVAVLPKTRRVFTAVVFANIFVPIASVSVGARFETPDGAVPVVRNAFIWTFPAIVTGVAAVASNTRRLPARKPVDPRMRPLAYTLPFAYTTFEVVSSINTFDPTQRSWVGYVFAAPMLFAV